MSVNANIIKGEISLIPKKPPKKEIVKLIKNMGFIESGAYSWRGMLYTLPCLSKFDHNGLIEVGTKYVYFSKCITYCSSMQPKYRIQCTVPTEKVPQVLLTEAYLIEFCNKIIKEVKRKEIEMIIGTEEVDE